MVNTRIAWKRRNQRHHACHSASRHYRTQLLKTDHGPDDSWWSRIRPRRRRPHWSVGEQFAPPSDVSCYARCIPDTIRRKCTRNTSSWDDVQLAARVRRDARAASESDACVSPDWGGTNEHAAVLLILSLLQRNHLFQPGVSDVRLSLHYGIVYQKRTERRVRCSSRVVENTIGEGSTWISNPTIDSSHVAAASFVVV
jgi:hypothetical protein